MTLTNGKALPVCILAALLAIACVSCYLHLSPKVWTEAEVDLDLPAASLDALLVKTHNGNVTVTGSPDAASIAVHALIKAGGADEADAAACLAAVKITTDIVDSEQRLGVEWLETRKRTWNVCVNFEVILPARFAVRADTHNGNVSIASIESPADIRTHNGNVTVRDQTGTLAVGTHNGNVTASATTASVSLETHNGNISFDAEADLLHCTTHNGDVSGCVTGPGAIDGKLSTHNGMLRLALGPDRSASIRCRTNNGRIRINREMAITLKEKRVVKGTIGGGAVSLDLSTYNGSVTLD